MTKVEITSRRSATAWLHPQPHQTKIWIAARAALRAMPGLASMSDTDFDSNMLKSFRTLLLVSNIANDPNIERGALSRPGTSREIDAPTASTARSAGAAILFASFVASRTGSHPRPPSTPNGPSKDDPKQANREAEEKAKSTTFAANSVKHSAEFLGPAEWAAVTSDAAHAGGWPPLWPDNQLPQPLEPLWLELQRMLQAAPEKWAFWLKWYEGILSGKPLPWELSLRIATEVTDEEWEAGPEVVARRITQIRASFEADCPLRKEYLQKQAKFLIANVGSSETTAHGLRSLIQMALEAYRREISNALPDSLEPLDNLPHILNGIATLLAGEQSPSDKEIQLIELIGSMASTVATLNCRLAAAHSRLNEVNREISGKTPRRLFADTFYVEAGRGAARLITSKILWGSLISGSALLLGADADALTVRLGECFQNIITPEMQSLPPAGPAPTWLPPTDV